MFPGLWWHCTHVKNIHILPQICGLFFFKKMSMYVCMHFVCMHVCMPIYTTHTYSQTHICTNIHIQSPEYCFVVCMCMVSETITLYWTTIMGLIPKEVNLPHQMLVGCSFFWGGQVWALKPLRFCHFHIIFLLILSSWRSFLVMDFCDSLTADSLVLHSLQSFDPFFLFSLRWKSCVVDLSILNEFCTNLWSLHCVHLLSFTGKSRPLMRTESYPHLCIQG